MILSKLKFELVGENTEAINFYVSTFLICGCLRGEVDSISNNFFC